MGLGEQWGMSLLNAAQSHASLLRMARRLTRQGYPVRDTFERSLQLRARHGRYGGPADPADLAAEVRQRMRAAEQAALSSGLPRVVWSFRAEEVGALDLDDNGQTLFRLHDGRVFDDNGDPRVTLP